MDAQNFPAIDSLWDYDKPQVTELKFRELLPAAEKSGNQSYYAELLTQLARTQSLQRKFDNAHDILNKAEQVIKGKNMPVAQIRYLLERGRTFNSANEAIFRIGLNGDGITLYLTCTMKKVNNNWKLVAIKQDSMGNNKQ